MLIISHARHNLKIGRTMVAEVIDAKGVSHTVTFLVIRKSTYPEWLRCYVELGGDIRYLEEIKKFPRRYPKHFYEILTD